MKYAYLTFWTLFAVGKLFDLHPYSWWWLAVGGVVLPIIFYVFMAWASLWAARLSEEINDRIERAKRRKKTGFATRLEEALDQQSKARNN